MPGKILIADDSLAIQKEITQLLKDSGAEVIAVSNGEHAVRKLADVKPDLVLADVFMPVRSGYEVCLFIKANPRFAHIPVLLLASKLEPYDEKEAARVCADGKLEKPITDPAGTRALLLEFLQKGAERAGEAASAPTEIETPAAAAPPAAGAGLAAPLLPDPEPESIDEFATAQPMVHFEPSDEPRSFADMEESPARAETSSAPPGSGTVSASGAELAGAAGSGLGAELPEAEVVSEEDAAGASPPEPTTIVQPELAAAWEMTGPPPGAPEIPSPAWDSQWQGQEEEGAAGGEAEESFAEPEALPAAPAVKAAPPTLPHSPYDPEEFADAFAKAQELAKKTIYSLPASQQLDPQTLEKIVQEVLARLSPQLMETIARELVRPLAESLLKEKLKP